MSNNYSYPIDLAWSTDDLTSVLHFLTRVELAYEQGLMAKELLDSYAQFKRVVPSKGQERQIDREFEAASGYSTYQAVKAAQQAGGGKIRLGR